MMEERITSILRISSKRRYLVERRVFGQLVEQSERAGGCIMKKNGVGIRWRRSVNVECWDRWVFGGGGECVVRFFLSFQWDVYYKLLLLPL